MESMHQRHRLFIAIDPAPEVAARAGRIAARLRDAGLEAAWGNPAQLHLTLCFLGDEVDDADLHRICVAMDEAAATVPAFRASFGGVGVFPDLRRPRVVWLGVGAGAAELGALHDALAERLEPLGIPPEARGFRPHLTLARFRSGRSGASAAGYAAALDACADVEGGETAITKACLYESRLAPTGAEYDRLHVSRLA
jgi:2'-5' RNA ligase